MKYPNCLNYLQVASPNGKSFDRFRFILSSLFYKWLVFEYISYINSFFFLRVYNDKAIYPSNWSGSGIIDTTHWLMGITVGAFFASCMSIAHAGFINLTNTCGNNWNFCYWRSLWGWKAAWDQRVLISCFPKVSSQRIWIRPVEKLKLQRFWLQSLKKAQHS